MNRAPNVSSPALRGLGASRMPVLPRRLNARASSGQPVRRRRELVVIREAASTEAKEKATGNGTTTGNANNGSSANGNGAGTAADNGKVAAASVNGNGNGVISERVASQNGVSSSNGASVLIGEIDVSASAGAGVEHPAMDPCDAGQLEACAATRNGASVVSNGAAVGTETVRSTEAQNGTSATEQASSGSVNAAAAAGLALPKVNSTDGTPYDSPGGRWSQVKGYSVWRRTLQIWIFALTFAFKYWRMAQKAKKLSDEEASKKKRELAVWLRLGLVRLGPTFIKIGQQFSTRVDVLSQEFVKELELLQDRVPAFDSKTARGIVKKSCGKSVEEIFDEFEDEPIAAASLGQVHLAKLKGQKVVVKVQRPGLKELFDIDLKNIRVLAQWLQAVDPKKDGAARDWVAIYDECSRILYEEIDYRMEAENADRFRKNFASTSWVKVPEVYMDYTTGETLVMEYCPGVKVNNAEAIDKMGLDRKLLARLAVESYLQQILRYGFFHADPHPGNVAVDAVDGGRLIYYDFGMMGSIRTDVRQGLLELFYAIYQRDSDRCLDALVQMGVLVPGGDRTAIRRTADFFLKSFEERLDSQQQERTQDPASQKEFKPQRSKDEAKARRKQILSAIGEDLLVTAADQPFRFPAAFTFVVRSFTVLDGIGKSLDPRFDISEIAAPYARELLLEARPQMSKIRSDIMARFSNQNRAVANLFKGPNQIEYIGETVQRLERGDLKLRVRTLETERALARMALYQQFLAGLVVACTLTNVATLMQTMGNALAAKLNFVAAGVVGIFCLGKLFKVKKEEEKEAVLSGTVA